MVKAVIFDMDGVIINTIKLGKRAERKVFKSRGITIKEEMYRDTMGLRENETIAYWCKKYGWQLDQKKILNEYMCEYEKSVMEKGAAIAGVMKSIHFFKKKGVPLGMASSSYMKQIRAVVRKLGLAECFEVVVSAEHEKYGKPHPAVYMTAAKKLGIATVECLAIEDSVNGILAAKAARMKCAYIPLEKMDKRARCMADITLASLSKIDDAAWEKIAQ